MTGPGASIGEGVDVCKDGGSPDEVRNVGWLHHPCTGQSIGIDFLPTGDGKPIGMTQCKWNCPGGNDTPYENTKWPMFDPLWNSEYGENEDDYSIDGYSSPYCNIFPESQLKSYVYNTAKKMTIYHARKLREQGIIIYCIGLASVEGTFLKEDISSWDPAHPEEEYYFRAPSASEMKRIFNQVAMEIKKYVYLVE